MPPPTAEPALRFWLQYAERDGALLEHHHDHALVLLPEPLRQATELPEELTVTADPDVAREDGAALLIAGHPEVERAAGTVLAEGDTGNAYLPWPASRPPTRSTLEAHARERVSVEHGRIDAAGEPIAAYLPLLRVGAMVSYSASLALRFHEQEEVWIDTRSGTAASERVLAALRDRALLPKPDGPARTLPADLDAAIAAAHELLAQHAGAREASLAAHARRMLDSELARAKAYYESALESIGRRRAKATSDRVRLLDAQAEATRVERDRRCREIVEEHRPRHDLRPFRLHLVHVPAFVLPVHARRGSRTFAFELTWIPGAGEFSAVRCPACGADQPLVATRERLGCRGCATPVRAPTRQAAPVRAPAQPVGSAPAPSPSSRRANRTTESTAGETAGQPRPVARPKPVGASSKARINRDRPRPRASARVDASASSQRTGQEHRKRTGNKLVFAFWQCVANGGRWPRQKIAPGSPLRAVYRLYGRAGPLCAIGADPGALVEEMSASTCPSDGGGAELTVGSIQASREIYPYAIAWSLMAGKPVIGEVMPAPHPLALPPVDGATAEIAARLRGQAPAPIVPLDAVGALLWRNELRHYGLPFAIRCLAAWWRVPETIDQPSPPEAVAAAVAKAVARTGRIRRTLDESAELYDTNPLLVTQAERAVKPQLRLDPRRGR